MQNEEKLKALREHLEKVQAFASLGGDATAVIQGCLEICEQMATDPDENRANMEALLAHREADAMKYLIQDLRQVVGNCAIFWRADRHGYTCNLKEAGHYTEAEAKAIERDDPNRSAILNIDEVEKISEVHADVQELPRRVKFTATDEPSESGSTSTSQTGQGAPAPESEEP